VKSGPHLEQAADAPEKVNCAGGRLRDLAQDFEKGALPRAVPPDDADHLSPVDFKRDLFQRLECFPRGRPERIPKPLHQRLGQRRGFLLLMRDRVGLGYPARGDDGFTHGQMTSANTRSIFLKAYAPATNTITVTTVA